MKYNIYLDMDGVIADFVSASLKIHNKICPWTENPKNKSSYEIIKLLGLTPTEFWDPISKDFEFWNNIPKTPEADEIVNHLMGIKEAQKDRVDVYICTSPSRNENSHYGKAKWLNTHYPKLTNKAIMTNHKHLLARQGAILIDDSDDNIKRFLKEGGRGVLVPRFWNSNAILASSSENVLKYIKQELHRLL